MINTSKLIEKINNIFSVPNTNRQIKTRKNPKTKSTPTNFKKSNSTRSKSKKSYKSKSVIYKQERIPEGFSSDVVRSVNFIRLNDKINIKPVGSYKYRIHSYPSDIDLFEKYEDCCDLKQVSLKIAKKFRQIGNLLLKSNKIFLREFKIGYDMDLFVDYGNINYKTNRVIDYNFDKMKKYLIKIRDNKYISNNQYNHLNKLLKVKPTLLEFLNIHENIRNLFILRWNINELVRGYKIIRNKKVTLEECLQHQTITKIDIWAPINNNYTEITNFYYLIFKNNNGDITFLCKELDNYILSLNNDISQYSSIEFRNSLKLAKKLWIKYNLLNKDKILSKLYPLFKSNAAKLNQIKEEIIVINEMFDHYVNKIDNNFNRNFLKIVLPIIKGQIEGFKLRINDIFEFELDYKNIFKYLNLNIKIVNEFVKNKSINKSKINNLKNNHNILIELMNSYIEIYSYNYLTKNQNHRLKKAKIGKMKKSHNIYTDLEIF